jgi:hypothetical protein
MLLFTGKLIFTSKKLVKVKNKKMFKKWIINDEFLESEDNKN